MRERERERMKIGMVLDTGAWILFRARTVFISLASGFLCSEHVHSKLLSDHSFIQQFFRAYNGPTTVFNTKYTMSKAILILKKLIEGNIIIIKFYNTSLSQIANLVSCISWLRAGWGMDHTTKVCLLPIFFCFFLF